MGSPLCLAFLVTVVFGSVIQRREETESCTFDGEPGRCRAEGECFRSFPGSESTRRRQACFHVEHRATICCPITGNLASSGRIAGGKDTKQGAYPWMAALLQKAFTRRPFCGGSLITPVHVLTAAHCVDGIRLDPNSFQVRIGEHNFDSQSEKEHRDFPIRQVHVHPDYVETEFVIYNDLAILELDSSCMDEPRTVCLPDEPADFRNREAVVIGWGVPHLGGEQQPPILQQVNVEVFPHEECYFMYGGITYDHICAGDPWSGGRDSCQGDSGGPLHVLQRGKWVQVGIVSYGVDCGKSRHPGVYMNVSTYLPWIASRLHPYRLNEGRGVRVVHFQWGSRSVRGGGRVYGEDPRHGIISEADDGVLPGEEESLVQRSDRGRGEREAVGISLDGCSAPCVFVEETLLWGFAHHALPCPHRCALRLPVRPLYVTILRFMRMIAVVIRGSLDSIGQDLISYRVRMGEHNFDTESEAQHQDFYIRRIHINPNYRKTDYAVYDDLAILELSGSWREDPKTACLPDRPVDTRNREAIVIGWGVTSMGSDFQPSVLQQVEVDIYPHEKCESLYRGIEFTHICAGDHDFGGKDSCLGDSGGPLHVCLGRRWVQVGIVSYGFHCGKPQQPGVYVNISSFLPWIVGNIHPYRLNGMPPSMARWAVAMSAVALNSAFDFADDECGKTSEDPGGTIRCFSVDEETEENDFDSVDTECDSTRLRYSNILGFFSSLIYLARLRAVGY
ncbi:unnamed protein product [Darwinula stevensoni]|uniref:limulus clotting factor C n=1 Tax=Darwinula stevensoni TaxID=69355 RepID=A0A7R9A9F5_9CRUS|nr:unnamed protein product [Darwinula stevensoni]CAG0897243.1 unnamed protein product [Darwinula stevensoni]